MREHVRDFSNRFRAKPCVEPCSGEDTTRASLVHRHTPQPTEQRLISFDEPDLPVGTSAPGRYDRAK